MKKLSIIIASIMLVIALGFFIYVVNHPELSWSWSNAITYIIYSIYFLVMVILFIAPFKNKQ